MSRQLPDFSTVDFDAVSPGAPVDPVIPGWDTPEGIPHRARLRG